MVVADLDRTVTFYRDMLGFELAAAAYCLGSESWALVRWGDAALLFQSPGAAQQPTLSATGVTGGLALTYRLYVEDVQALYERTCDRVHVLSPPRPGFSGGMEFSVRDCNGFVLTFIEAEGGG
ncbi:MAG TPA: VOC family protein [Rhodothermales bacterium]|nr:VOC family protein [Rhodothermales bacterium]